MESLEEAGIGEMWEVKLAVGSMKSPMTAALGIAVVVLPVTYCNDGMLNS